MLIRQLVAVAALSAALMQGAVDQALPQLDVEGEIFLVNRQQTMSGNYIPETVAVDAPGASRLMRPDAAKALEEMYAAAKKEARITMITVSGYRSFDKQILIYGNKLDSVGTAEKAQEYVAPPGASEHQLGLAMDVGARGASSGLNGSFGRTKAGKWICENAHRFGFIVRYQEGWEEITGYNYEPWHVRYVGIAYATQMYEQNVPMEIYVQNLRVDTLLHLLKP